LHLRQTGSRGGWLGHGLKFKIAHDSASRIISWLVARLPLGESKN
jgi:hypothetical protein